MCELLLDRGADVDARCSISGKALTISSRKVGDGAVDAAVSPDVSG